MKSLNYPPSPAGISAEWNMKDTEAVPLTMSTFGNSNFVNQPRGSRDC